MIEQGQMSLLTYHCIECHALLAWFDNQLPDEIPDYEELITWPNICSHGARLIKLVEVGLLWKRLTAYGSQLGKNNKIMQFLQTCCLQKVKQSSCRGSVGSIRNNQDHIILRICLILRCFVGIYCWRGLNQTVIRDQTAECGRCLLRFARSN
jgi:hypothetical protein